MKKLLLPILLIAAILLSACAAAEKAVEPTATPTAAPTQAAASGDDQTAATKAITSEENPCVPFNIIDYILGEPYPGLPEVTDEDYIFGPNDAPVTFIVYSDPQCPYCARFDPIMNTFAAQYPDDVRVVFRFFPLSSIHDKARLSSQAMVAAGLQGKFDEFRVWLFLHQNKDPNNPAVANLADTEFWSGLPPADFADWLKNRVSDLGIDPDQLVKDMLSDAVVKKVEDAETSAEAIGIPGTPSLFVNGYAWKENQMGVDILSTYTNLILSRKNGYESCPAMVIDQSKSYSAVIATSKGDINVNLFADKAPYAVNSFVFLARDGWYNDLPILATNLVVLTGDPTSTGYGGPGYAYKDEVDNNLSFNEPGLLATIGFLPGSNGSTFVISKGSSPIEQIRTIFGKVSSGLDVVNNLTNGDKLISVTITEK